VGIRWEKKGEQRASAQTDSERGGLGQNKGFPEASSDLRAGRGKFFLLPLR
jgi:hypothetical protein